MDHTSEVTNFCLKAWRCGLETLPCHRLVPLQMGDLLLRATMRSANICHTTEIGLVPYSTLNTQLPRIVTMLSFPSISFLASGSDSLASSFIPVNSRSYFSSSVSWSSCKPSNTDCD